MRRIFILLLFLFIVFESQAQRYRLTDTLSVFPERVNEMMLQTRNEKAAEAAAAFQQAWSSGAFTQNQQNKIASISLGMIKKDYGPIPFFVQYLSLISSATQEHGISGSKIDNLLDVLEKSINQTNSKTYLTIISNLNTFFSDNALHKNNFNKLYHENASYDFEYVGEVSPEEDIYEPPAVSEVFDSWDSWDSNDDWEKAATSESSNDSWSEPTIFTDAIPLDVPVLTGALIKFSNVDLIFATPFDSTAIIGTKGDFSLSSHIFSGNGGTANWESADISRSDLWVNLQTFQFNVRLPEFTAEKVKMHYPKLLNQQVEGIITFKSIKRKVSEEPRYPRFISYHSNVDLNKIEIEGAKFTGGFAMEGKRIRGASVYGNTSEILIRDAAGNAFKANSKVIDVTDTVISARNAAVVIYHSRDSIYHPSMRLRYYIKEKRLVAIKEQNGHQQTPFNSTHFNVSITADAIRWNMETDSLDIYVMNARSMIPAYFESNEYYHFDRIKELSVAYPFNPLLMVYNHYTKHKQESFYVSDLLAQNKVNENALRSALLQLSYKDYIAYDVVSGKITIKPKLIHYNLARWNKIDFDDLQIRSMETHKPNATLNLTENELLIRGVDQFFISQTQNVFIIPTNREIKMQKNRNFSFNGDIYAGNFQFIGRDFIFRYDSFQVDMSKIDSIKFYVDTQQRTRKQVDNQLISMDMFEQQIGDVAGQSSSGTLYVDNPKNKSGNLILPRYPVFDADKGAVVYFDRDDILKKAYDRSVYFIVPPFGIDSISSSDPSNIGFEGRFVSDNIFPDFNETLRIMPDYALGFEHEAPPAGYDLYKTGARFFNKIRLDKKGIVGSGRIDYLSSTGNSDAYTFYQDSVLAAGHYYRIRRDNIGGVTYPEILVENYKMKWLPKTDQMYVRNTKDPFRLYESASLEGTTVLSKTGVRAAGKFLAEGFEARSRDFGFEESKMSASRAKFFVLSDNPQKPLMQGNDIRLDFDFNSEIGEISPEIAGMAALEFPYAQVNTSISRATWLKKENKIVMTKPENVDISDSYFYSTNRELDSLAFNASEAEYDIITAVLHVKGIPHIEVADAFIIPSKNEIFIGQNSELSELKNATIIIDTLNEYHTLTDATVTIHSRNKFTGSANYQYVNASKDTFQIRFDSFDLQPVASGRSRSKPEIQTVSSAMIDSDLGLQVSPFIQFKGELVMYARQRALKLDGFVKLDLRDSDEGDMWIRYSSQDEEAQDVMLDFNNAITESGQPIIAGLFYEGTDNFIYGRFMKNKLSETDIPFFTPSGFLYYNHESGSFVIEDSAKASGNSYQGKFFSYNDQTGEIAFEGPMKFLEDSPNTTMEATGNGKGNIKGDPLEIDIFARFDFDLPDQAFIAMHKDMQEVVEGLGLPPAEPDFDALLYKIAEFVGDRYTREYEKRNQRDYFSLTALSPKLIGDIVLSKLKLNWSEKYNSWYSTGPIGISHLLKLDVNASAEGFVEIQKTMDKGDIINIFVQLSGDCWYYISYGENKLITFSSNQSYNDIIASRSKVEKAGFGDYFFAEGNRREVLNYIDRFRLDYLNIKDPYVLETRPLPVQDQPLDILFQDQPLPQEKPDETEFWLPEEKPAVKKTEEEEENEGF
ncbi:MAG: hypothetical protein JJU28_22120 [Cyclobacteriaceae bacterium]|nr:hypothetical protein [Cyclobacteriaceae bacterium]